MWQLKEPSKPKCVCAHTQFIAAEHMANILTHPGGEGSRAAQPESPPFGSRRRLEIKSGRKPARWPRRGSRGAAALQVSPRLARVSVVCVPRAPGTSVKPCGGDGGNPAPPLAARHQLSGPPCPSPGTGIDSRRGQECSPRTVHEADHRRGTSWHRHPRQLCQASGSSVRPAGLTVSLAAPDSARSPSYGVGKQQVREWSPALYGLIARAMAHFFLATSRHRAPSGRWSPS
ncbi:uncharacterized protein LOC124089224 [Marmota monax]|uniref:uncharacterized protein LOC124089224 n=1 Tax=Marmota monax TaxID=9995 RepID=UPI001EB0890F|nr:uncharacterized protein LOC124089224 [Marmota monax]